jgi:hypothetical protein
MRTLHGSDGIITTAHCFGIVLSMGLRSAAMRFCWVDRERGGRPIIGHLHFGRTISVFMNESNGATNHLPWRRLSAGRPEVTVRNSRRPRIKV